MNFLQLIAGAECLARQGNPEIAGVAYDSRRVMPGHCFVAIRGETTDGNRYVDAALRAGAVAIVSDSLPPRPGIPWARVAHGRTAMAHVSANFYGHPARKLFTTGVTGTNGKTTTTLLLHSMFRHAGRKAALIGTIEYRINTAVYPSPHTTPESLELTQFFAGAVESGCTESVMEVSSHALDQRRVFGIPFNVVVFTNLTRDHLDYHSTMEEYFVAKRRLFIGCGSLPPRTAVLNIDDEYGRKLIGFCGDATQVVTYGIGRGDFHARDLSLENDGSQFRLATPIGEIPVYSPLLGRVNVYNVVAAFAASYARNVQLESVAEAVANVPPVPGRFEQVNAGQPFTVIVDYAHTDAALRNLTHVAREFLANRRGSGRVITVFGCGGDRDQSKRPLMGEAAAEGSDFVVLTSDNPRSEDPISIIDQILPGLRRHGTRFTVDADRRRAINLAVQEARPGDIVLIAGKGHEKIQVTKEGAFPFDDVEVAHEALTAAGYGPTAMRSAAS